MSTRLASAALLAVMVLGGCAQERAPINRVQADALKKSFFVGDSLTDTSDDPEFYAQGTLIDVGYGASQDGLFTSTYAQPLSRVKFVITEKALIARLTYERIQDSDGKGAGPASTDGTIVGIYAIRSHFDITQAYNSTTGEKLNILDENQSDRPWYEREYMRVDWSQNLATDTYDFDTLSLLGVYGGVKYEPMAYYVNDPSDENHPYFDTEDGYFDVTVKAFARPQMIDLSSFGWGIDSFPACFLENDFMGGSWPAGNCNPVELTIRQAFRKIVPNDYAPQDWDGYRFQAYGAFTNDRFGFARNYGMTDTKWHRFINRYDIWERSHYYADPATMTGPVECFTPHTTPYGDDPHRDVDGDGTEDECAAVTAATNVGGSKCNTFTQKCTLPFRLRTPKSVVWYYTDKSDQRFFEGTEWAANEWDVALRGAVRTAQYTECVATGGSDCANQHQLYFGQQDENEDAVALAREVDDCRVGLSHPELGKDEAACTALADSVGAARGVSSGVISIAKMPQMVVLCHSPVEENDAAQCGGPRLPAGMTAQACADPADAAMATTCDAALNVRRGDIRYHQVNVIEEPQTPSPWGIMVDAIDPLTGETISTSVNCWSYINDLWSQGLVDTARYIAGELTDADITEGENIRKWAEASEAANSNGVLPRLTRDQLDERMAAFTKSTPERVSERRIPDDSPMMKLAKDLRYQIKDVKASMGAPSVNTASYAARRQNAIGTPVEAALMNTYMQQLYGITGMPLNDQVMNVASPLRGGNPQVQRDIQRWKELALAKRGACMLSEAPAPLGIPSLSKVLQEKFGAFDPNQSPVEQQARAEKMRALVAQRAHFSVIVHEMGHSIGLRHNFVSSADAFAYRPQYWQLRTRNGAVSTECTELTTRGKDCVGPRYYDPITNDESDQMIYMFMQSSIMDYAGEATQDMIGIGAWDFAAARMFYSDSVAVFSDPSYVSTGARGMGMLSIEDTFGGILGLEFQIGANSIHYSALQKNFDLIKDCQEVDPNNWKPANWNDAELGAWSPLFDARIGQVDGKYTRCKTQPVDYVRWDDLRNPTETEVGNAFYRGGPAVDSQNRIRVPYGFATDSWADLGNLSVYRHDNGADPYEFFNFEITQQEIYHIWDNYRRNRQNFSVRSAAARSLGRYNEKLRDAAKGLGLFANIYKFVSVAEGYNFDDFWPEVAPFWFHDQILAAGLGFDHFARQAARPAEGNHYAVNGDSVLRSDQDTWGTPSATLVRVPNGGTGYFGDVSFGGRPLENQLADNKGEYDSSFTINAGSYYDKIWTAMLMTESVDNFISSSRGDFYDARYRSVSMADLFPEGYRRWLATNLTNDDELKGPRVEATSDGRPIVDAQGFPAAPIGWTTWWSPEVESCFPGAASTVCTVYGNVDSDPLNADAPANTAILDPQLGWEQQKFLIAWTLIYLPENQMQNWLDMMRIWELGSDTDPGVPNRIEFHNPVGQTYVAKTFGKEVIFGKTVQKGIAARVLEYANQLLELAYVTDPGPDLDNDGAPDWFIPQIDPASGQPVVRWDPTIEAVVDGFLQPNGKAGCNAADSSKCTCAANRACIELQQYVSVPAYLRQSLGTYFWDGLHQKGIY